MPRCRVGRTRGGARQQEGARVTACTWRRCTRATSAGTSAHGESCSACPAQDMPLQVPMKWKQIAWVFLQYLLLMPSCMVHDRLIKHSQEPLPAH